MEANHKFEETARQIRKLSLILVIFFMAIAGILIYLMVDPTLSAFQSTSETEFVTIEEPPLNESDFDKIEDGIHIRTGFVDGKGLMAVVNNCTNCHSAKLVTQNRMTEDGWRATIRWMQETQNLWDLGKNEEIIVRYLAEYYAPEEKGRRQNLADIEWYVLD